jgi:DNA-binding CsgD family transcriptional regulator
MADKPASTSVSSPPHLSDQYHNARNRYALFSALLLAWNFLGVQIDIKSLFANVSVSFPTPEKVPILLTGLVLYYAYRICIEWNQCDGIRRSYTSSQVDFAVTHSIGFASILTYGVQQAVPQLGQMVIERTPISSIFCAVGLILASGLILRHFVSTPLLLNGEKVISRPLFNHWENLSLREMTILQRVMQGKTNREIAQILGVTERTVRFHVEGIFTKLDVSSRTQAVAVAMEHGLARAE